MLDIARDKKNIEKDKEKRKIRKIQTATINASLLLHFVIEKFIFC